VGDRIESLAGRFAAKEAVAKGIGNRFGMISCRISKLNADKGRTDIEFAW
jgi:phosphopantetheinyl transferase (holo-ACP synthase)